MKIVGFTGTRNGMTSKQKASVRRALKGADEAHHGDCVGADEQFHDIAHSMGIPIVIHPPNDPKLRARCQNAKLVKKPKPYLDRNKDIVHDSSLMLGAPKEGVEPRPGRGQGTWSTIRYARQLGKELKVIFP